MPVESKERVVAFKVGFLRKLAENGMTPADFHELVKQSMLGAFLSGMGDAVGGTAQAGMGLGGNLANMALRGAVLAPAVGGLVTGGLEAKLTSPSVEDMEAVRKAELTARLKAATQEIRARMSARAQAHG